MTVHFSKNCLRYDALPTMPDSDFFRLYLDGQKTGRNRDLGVYSHAQTPAGVRALPDGWEITYDRLVAEDGSVHEIGLSFTVREAAGGYAYSVRMENRGDDRLNECQYPLFDLPAAEGGRDTLYVPQGLGARFPDPHAVAAACHTEYIAADYKNVWKTWRYPGELSMSFCAYETAAGVLYIGYEGAECRLMNLLLGTEPREAQEKRLLLGFASFPALCRGESLTYTGFSAAPGLPNWCAAADRYRRAADWFHPAPRKAGIAELNGWQRLILRHQYGEILHTYADLPAIYRAGARHGIRMLLLFGWWEEGMDNGYPHYRPDEALGGADGLAAAIDEIHREGGRVVLYANGHLIDAATDFADAHPGCVMRDIDGNPIREAYRFAGNGTLLRDGYKTFYTGCHGTAVWRDTLAAVAARHIALGSDGTFFDQLNICFNFCFDRTHEHGARIDADPEMRRRGIAAIRAAVGEDTWFGTEWVVDRLSAAFDFTHGCGMGAEMLPHTYPYLVRYTFPEFIVSNRNILDEKEGYRRYLSYAFVFGFLYDVSLWRGRIPGTMEDFPGYTAILERCLALRARYRDFFLDARAEPAEAAEGVPAGVTVVRYRLAGRTLLCVWNDTAAAVTVRGERVAAGDIAAILRED